MPVDMRDVSCVEVSWGCQRKEYVRKYLAHISVPKETAHRDHPIFSLTISV